VPCRLHSTGNAPDSTPHLSSPGTGGVPRQGAEGQGGSPGFYPGETTAYMTAAALLTLLNRADEKTSYEQLRTWVVTQAVHNALQTFHGCPALDPDDPASGKGFISDGQMRALNITIRRAAHEALAHVDAARNVPWQAQHRKLHASQQEALDFCEVQLGTVRDYMEPPGSLELEDAYKRYVSEPGVNR
jgi:hypothetical protein